jgi:hypothetical protein
LENSTEYSKAEKQPRMAAANIGGYENGREQLFVFCPYVRHFPGMQTNNEERYKVLFSWMARVCYFHTTGRRLLDEQSVEECYREILPIGNYVDPFVFAFQRGEVSPQGVSAEPMISRETYARLLRAFDEERASFTTIEDDYGPCGFEVHIGLDGDREKIATIDNYTTLAMAE